MGGDYKYDWLCPNHNFLTLVLEKQSRRVAGFDRDREDCECQVRQIGFTEAVSPGRAGVQAC